MPWIKQEDCIGCGTCVEECPVDVITMEDEKAKIEMDNCIRCGTCHDVCPEDAVRHDSEKIPQEVEANIEWTNELMQYYQTAEEREGFINRMKKHFNKEKMVMEQTLERLEALEM
jgi:ferredoxin